MKTLKGILRQSAEKIWPENTVSLSAIEEGQKKEPAVCPQCKSPVPPVYLSLLERWIIPACPCQVEAYHLEEERRREKQRNDRVQRLFANSGLGPRFSHCTLDNWIRRSGTQKAFSAASDYVKNLAKNIKTGQGLLIFGPCGNGKSHLAAALTHNALAMNKTAIFQRVPSLLAFIRSSYQEGEFTEGEIMRTLASSDLLVLDDAGAEKWSQWTEPTLYTIIDERYSWEKALILTTNSDLEGLEQKVGSRAMDRLLEMCQIVENRGTSFRQEKAFQKKGGF